MRGGLAPAMVVFKCVLLFIFVFGIQGTRSKPPYDDKTESSGISSTLWGWVSYLNPWGSSSDTSSPPKLEEVISSEYSDQTTIKPVVKARQLTAATTPVKTTVQETTSVKSIERKVTPIISVQISSTIKPNAEDLEPGSPAKTGERIPIEIKSTSKPLASTTPFAVIVDNPATTEETTSEQYTELDSSDQEITTTMSPRTDDLLDSRVSTTPNLSELSTTEKPETDLPKELVSSIHMPYLDNDFTTNYLDPETTTRSIGMDHNVHNILISAEEYVTVQPLELEVSTISILPDKENPVALKYLIESNTTVFNAQTVTDQQFQPGFSVLSITMVSEFPTSTEKIKSEPLLGSDITTSSKAFNNPIKEVYMTDDLIESDTESTLTSTEQNTAKTEDINTENSLELEFPRKEEEDGQQQEKEVEVSVGRISTLTNNKEEVFSERFKTYLGTDEEFIPIENDIDSYAKLQRAVFRPAEGASTFKDLASEPLETVHKTVFKPVSIESITDVYLGLANAVAGKDNEMYASVLTNIVTEPDPQITISLLGIEEELPSKIKTLIQFEPTSHSYPALDQGRYESTEGTKVIQPISSAPVLAVAIPEREYSTEESKVTLANPVTSTFKIKIKEVPDSSELDSNQILEVEKSISTLNMAIEVDSILRAANKAFFTEKDELIDVPLVPRSRNTGFQLTFDCLRFMVLFYVVRIFLVINSS